MAEVRKSIAATSHMKRLMADYFTSLDTAKKNGSPKIAWCTSVGPAELLHAMGFQVYYPENHGALLGATRLATDFIPLANAIGYSPDICSYLTSDVGAYLKGITPLTKAYGLESVPKADVLVYNTNQCRDVQDWFAFYAREWNVPIVGLHTHRNIKSVDDHHIADLVAQLKEMIPILEEVSGNRFDIDRLREVVGLSLECTRLWRQVLECGATIPAPLTFFDTSIHMAPAVVLRGLPEAVEYYKLLLSELHERIENKVAAIEGERHRIYWDGMPIWGKLRDLSELFTSLKTNIVASTYCNSWIFDAFDPAQPLESMARAYTELFIVRDETYKEAYMDAWITKFSVDGVIFHDAKTCPNNSNSRYCMPQRMTQRLKVPTLVINGDLNDLRCYSEEQAKTNIEAFIEQLDEKK
ncbi:2-hydroxyacyl-CoA dehydratase subunit D [Desulfomonile tiedjei]|uniref:Benzoyl-CoA reductase/2-hydroxyglutaryl-CoA dehydratase subunit, BcrC/BadD/HgdB n=1 Tax=Desulfomonile tiedjei (strain ATCC 49306 / DSM 6799 / DCB-1) TaxID=706587 RepID=I4C3Y4_DESTA|nr:2-hydroxyacyl-CoA dehydratase family protein [Desulfomonile tiedjei]AFM24275.1 Benzoyl-CoA reductase/2-hydroxyglutaryl-CoA dehydratase subunit, BcrC/BadD/HgdB [Desulfomonile tiedjei DSM 6799]